MRRVNSLVKTRRPLKVECRSRRGWHRIRWLDSIIDSTRTPGASGGQRSLNYYSPWGRKQLDMTCWLNNNTCYDIFVVVVHFLLLHWNSWSHFSILGTSQPLFHLYRFLHLFSHFVTSYAYIWPLYGISSAAYFVFSVFSTLCPFKIYSRHILPSYFPVH